jgi:hypothetical protein
MQFCFADLEQQVINSYPSQIKSYMASFLTKPKTKSETSSSTLQVQFKEIPKEDVGQDETL